MRKRPPDSKRISTRLIPSRTELRFLFLLTIALSVGLIGYSWLADPATGTADRYVQVASQPVEERQPMVGERDNITVIAGMDSPFKRTKALYAFNESGVLIHYSNNSVYGDVDPTDNPREVMVATHDYYDSPNTGCEQLCTEQQITYVNLTTGEHRAVHTYTILDYRNSNWHDVDHIGGDRYLVGDLKNNKAYVINISSGVREWSWDAQSEYPLTGGGPFPSDWTHLNDVEAIEPPTGEPGHWYMLDLRNQDQVVFIDPERGLQANWTLGCEDCHDTLFEQHNPDYIPPANGGPAVLVSDSENSRIVEYQRVGDQWKLSWVYQDKQMSWPRDADRLPNGHTLITDSHGTRVFEVDQNGTIVWEANIINGYDAERLGTGDESTGGPSAVKANLTNVTTGERSSSPALANELEWEYVSYITRWWHAAEFVFPVWVTMADIFIAIGAGLLTNLWLALELYWRGVRLRLPIVRQGSRSGAITSGLPERLHVAYLFGGLGLINGVLGGFLALGVYQLWAF